MAESFWWAFAAGAFALADCVAVCLLVNGIWRHDHDSIVGSLILLVFLSVLCVGTITSAKEAFRNGN